MGGGRKEEGGKGGGCKGTKNLIAVLTVNVVISTAGGMTGNGRESKR